MVGGACALALMAMAWPARAALPDAATILKEVGYSPADIDSIMRGKIVSGTIKPGTSRELVGAFAFVVKSPPAALVEELKSGLLGSVDSNTISRGTISAEGAIGDFAKLSLSPNTKDRIASYLEADHDLNLSSDEAAALKALAAAGTTDTATVEQAVRGLLLARYQAYHAQGLMGIAPYARAGSKQRSVADEIKSANADAALMKKYAPTVYAVLTGYPASKPQWFEEIFSWTQFDAHDVPTIALVHAMFVPDGDGFVVVQRQYYVSSGFNCEQATAAFLPVQSGTLVLYGNRTSTDQVEGTGGGLKRSIGSKLLSSELQSIFSKLQTAAK